MYEHLLLATDGSELAERAVDCGLALAKTLGARVTAVTVSEPWAAAAPGEAGMAIPVEEYDEATATLAGRILAEVSEAARKLGVACETVHVKGRFPAQGILETAAERGCDLIVMASHGRRGVARLLLGSQAAQVLSHSTVPVLVCR